MSANSGFRHKLTPFLASVFVLVGFSGTLMFLHIDAGFLEHLHKWLGILLVACGIIHLYLNWRPFKAYLKEGGYIPPVLALVLLSFLLMTGGNGDHHGDRDGHQQSYHVEDHEHQAARGHHE